MKIAIAGMKKDVMEQAIKSFSSDIETIVTTDIAAVPMIKNGLVDYYFGACESGAGAAISILIGMVGYSKCCTVAKNGGKADKKVITKFISEGKVIFGMAHDTIEKTVPILLEALFEERGEN